MREDGAGQRIARITEVEAYGGPDDRASHARFGATARTRSMFGPPGMAYVYRVYGMHACLNVVTGPAGAAAAVLLRAAEPVTGVDCMRAARVARAVATRAADRADPAAAQRRVDRVPAARLTLGPANLAAAFGVDVTDDGRDLLDPASPLRLEPAPQDERPTRVVATPRIGVAYAGPGWADRPWRFVEVPASSAGSAPVAPAATAAPPDAGPISGADAAASAATDPAAAGPPAG